MQDKKNVIDCYDKTANNYADKFIDELSKKHFDRLLLRSFANENKDKGKIIDLGCGPGQTTKFLFDCGMKDIAGTDISSKMIDVAKNINPQISFETADMLKLQYADQTFGAAIAFYSIVHFTYDQVKIAFKEIARVLKNEGQFLFSFHVGDETIHLDNFLDQPVSIDFYFLSVDKILTLLSETGFETIDVIERRPYEGVEHASRRAYVWVKKRSP
jgi:ubiquinone/menaquinone biosynthesis C-methylase UbiE